MNEKGIKVSARPILVLTCFFIAKPRRYWLEKENIELKDRYIDKIVENVDLFLL